MRKTLSWGIIGTGRMAGVFANGVKQSQTGTLVAVGSRSQAAADTFGETWYIPHRYSHYEIERPDYDAWAHTILVDPRARACVSGVGYQWAGKGAVQRTHQSWPELRLLQTESECGDGSNTWDYAHYVFTQLHHYLSNGVNGYVYWNMVLPPGGRSTWGWTQNSMLTVDVTQQTVIYNPEFYVMKHFAHFVPPGSVRLDLQGPWSGNALAFQTPDRSTVVVCANPFSEQGEVVFDVANDRFLFRLDAHSLNTIVFDG